MAVIPTVHFLFTAQNTCRTMRLCRHLGHGVVHVCSSSQIHLRKWISVFVWVVSGMCASIRLAVYCLSMSNKTVRSITSPPPPLKTSLSLQDPYMFEPSCRMKVDEYGFFITWKSEGKVQLLYFLSCLTFKRYHLGKQLCTQYLLILVFLGNSQTSTSINRVDFLSGYRPCPLNEHSHRRLLFHPGARNILFQGKKHALK